MTGVNTRAARIIQAARTAGQTTLSEYDSKRVLKLYGVPTSKEVLVTSLAAARKAATKIGYPVVLKACSADATHKTELGLVAVGLGTAKELADAYRRMGKHYRGAWLVQEMVKGQREVMIGMVRDAQFGPSVMFGLGGIFTEILQDVSFRVAPVRKRDALDMMAAIRAHRILDAVRGMKPVDRQVMARSIMALGRIGLDFPAISEIDVNPMIIRGSRPVAVDGLIVFGARET
jgi:acetyl-CoA synthetase (ADP-forming)